MRKFIELVTLDTPIYRCFNNDFYILNVSKTEYFKDALKDGGVIINGYTYKYDKENDKLIKQYE